MQAIILAGKGQSNNLSPFIETRVKPQFCIAGETILVRLIKQLIESNVKKIFVVIDSFHQDIKNTINAHQVSTLAQIDFVELDKPMGIGNAIQSCKNRIDPEQHFLLVYGDTIFEENPFYKLFSQYSQLNNQFIASVSHSSTLGHFSAVFFDNNLKITDIVEQQRDDNYVLSGCFVFDSQLFKLLENQNNQMDQVFRSIIKEHLINACIIESTWLDISFPWDIINANKMLLSLLKGQFIAENVQIGRHVDIQGDVFIEEGVTIRSGSAIYGPCYIGKNVVLNNNCLVRDHTTLMDHCSIGFSTEIKNSIILQNANIERLSYIGDSVIGENVSVDSSCISINYLDGESIKFDNGSNKLDTHLEKIGVFIGDNTIIKAHTTFQPAQIIHSS